MHLFGAVTVVVSDRTRSLIPSEKKQSAANKWQRSLWGFAPCYDKVSE
jgi:hypothetical protein